MAVTLRWFGAILLLFVMVSASFYSGLFFDRDVYMISMFWGAAGMLLAAGYLWTRGHHFAIQLHSPLFPLLFLAGWMLLIYICHWIRDPLSTEGTGSEIVRFGLIATVGSAVWMVSSDREGGRVLRLIWHITGMLLCGSALLAVYGLWDQPYLIYRTADPAVSATGARLGGLLQYPNTFGTVMAAFLLERLFALPAALRTRRTTLGAAAALLPLAPYTAALLLTESRGAWLAAALACAAGFAADRRFAAPILAAAAAPAAGAALLYRQLAAAQLAPAVLPGLLWLAGLWAGAVLAGLMLCRAAGLCPGPARKTGRAALAKTSATSHAPAAMISESAAGHKQAGVSEPAETPSFVLAQNKGSAPAQVTSPPPRPESNSAPSSKQRISKWTGRRLSTWLALAAAAGCYIIALTCVLVPLNSRIQQGETMSARQLMYKDAWELFQSAPWLGQGGDTWRLSFQALQSQPYVGGEVHSGYIDLLLNTGVIGLSLAVVLLMAAGYRLYIGYPRLLPPFLALIIHSLIDFDWSFGLVWLLMIWLAAMGEQGQSNEKRRPNKRNVLTKPTLATQTPQITPTAQAPQVTKPTEQNKPINPIQQAHRTQQTQQSELNKSTYEPKRPNYLNQPNQPKLLLFQKRIKFLKGKCIKTAMFAKSLKQTKIPMYPVLCTISVFCLTAWTVLAYSFGMGSRNYELAILTVDKEKQEQLLRSSLRWNPYAAAPALKLAELLPADKAIPLLMNHLAHSPGHPELTWKIAELQAESGNSIQAAAWYRISLRQDKYNSDKQTQAVSSLADLARKERTLGRDRTAVQTAYSALGIYELYQSTLEELLGMSNAGNDRNFRITYQAAQESQRMRQWIRENNYSMHIIYPEEISRTVWQQSYTYESIR